jgi:hypothetical protein
MFQTLRKPVFLLLALIVLAHTAQGQDTSKGTIAGIVRDSSGATLSGVTVNLQSPLGERSATTGANGEYAFLNLPVGANYAISVSKDGFQPVHMENLAVHANRQTTVDITLATRDTTQTVKSSTVRHDIDFEATTSTAHLAEPLYQNTPIQRNISAILSMAPGVDDSGTAGRLNPSISGASAFETQYLVDGVNLTNPMYGGIGPAQAVVGSPGSGVNFDFLKEAQVITGAADARYGQATGGIVNLVTKDGGNAFHGNLYGYFQPRQFEVARPDANRLTVNQRTHIVNEGRFDFGGDVGGYLLRNKLFFYGGFNPQFTRSYRIAPPLFANSKLGETLVKTDTWNYTAKVSWSLTPKHQIEGSVFADPSRTPMGFTRVYSLAADDDLMASKLNFGSRIWTGRYTGQWMPNWLFNAHFSRSFIEFRETPKHEGYQVIDNTAVQRGTGSQVIRGGLGLLENTESRANLFSWSSTYRGSFYGSHALTFGYQFENRDLDRIFRYTGAPFTLPDRPEFGMAAGKTMYGAALVRRYLNPADPASPVVLEVWGGNYSSPNMTGWTRYHGAYLEDAWTIGNRVTVRPGLRWEKQRISGPSSINPSFGDNWAPRVGVVFDPDGKRNSKLFFNWGRFYERIPGVLAVRYNSPEWTLRGVLYRDQSGTIDLSPSNYIGNRYASSQMLRFTGGPSLEMMLAGDPKPGYQDEFVAGYERDLGRSVTFSGRYIRRDLRRVLDDASLLSLTNYEAGMPQRLILTNPSSKLSLFGPEARMWDPKRVYNAMELVVTANVKPNWQSFANYRLANLTGNYEGLYGSEAGLLAPYMSSMFDFTNADLRMFDVARSKGDLPLDRRHSLKLFTNYQFTGAWLKNFSLGAGWSINSGLPITRYVAHPAYGTLSMLPSGERGALGRTDWTYPLDLHASYTWKVAENKHVKFVADFFNLFNQKSLIRVDQNSQLDRFTANPDFLKPNTLHFGSPYQTPFHARLGIRFQF